MARVKRYLDIDVYTAALQRAHHIYDLFDSVAVCFSGGKDSLATLHVMWEAAQARGLKHVDVVFRDEELIPRPVIDFVDQYRRLPWVKMLWFAVPLASHKFILGRTLDYVQWDPNRPHVRPVPEWAITLPPGDTRSFDQYTMDAFVATYYKGKVGLVTGIRASESIIRYRSCVEKLNDNYIVAATDPKAKHVNLCKPLYDWAEDDVFRYFYEKGLRYCPLYDAELFAGENLRVSTPLHAEAAKRLDKLRAIDPELADGITRVFPEMIVQERYWKEMDRQAVEAAYGTSYEGVRRWIDENLKGAQLDTALKKWNRVMVRARGMPRAYPPNYLLRVFMTGAYKREIIPCGNEEGQARWNERLTQLRNRS